VPGDKSIAHRYALLAALAEAAPEQVEQLVGALK
jgi:5-enolpyruvylshikimate-3-phosphate synthase